MNPLVYGKDTTERVVGIEPGDATATLFIEDASGITTREVPNSHYILFTEQHSPKFKRLAGDQPYRWLYETDSRAKWEDVRSASYKKGYDLHVIRDPKEALMIKDGYTYFKGMKVSDVSVLSFDIETNGLVHNADSTVYLISNTLRKNGVVTRKLFSLDEFESGGAMIVAWCDWVRKMDPSIIVGHNIFSFDLPYLDFVASKSDRRLNLGRLNGGPAVFNPRTSQFRKDGSQTYDYNNVSIYGREVVDTFFLSMKYDIGRNYESYGLKAIVKHEGLERPGRDMYNASQIKNNWSDEKERTKIKAYAIDDADDSLKLFDLMIPSFFYYTQSVPRSLQWIINSATGSQINSLMVRAYLQQGHSIAKGSPAVEYEGAISFGIPGVHKNVFKVDVRAMYPSIMREYKIYNPDKDPQALFTQIVAHFMEARLVYKRNYKETKDVYWKAMDDSAKVVVNSAYGFLGAGKLNYNYPIGAAEVTRHGREIFQKAAKVATGSEYRA
jgi:DNA polymerase, archaea type